MKGEPRPVPSSRLPIPSPSPPTLSHASRPSPTSTRMQPPSPHTPSRPSCHPRHQRETAREIETENCYGSPRITWLGRAPPGDRNPPCHPMSPLGMLCPSICCSAVLLLTRTPPCHPMSPQLTRFCCSSVDEDEDEGDDDLFICDMPSPVHRIGS